jgi:hypothetical protein
VCFIGVGFLFIGENGKNPGGRVTEEQIVESFRETMDRRHVPDADDKTSERGDALIEREAIRLRRKLSIDYFNKSHETV